MTNKKPFLSIIIPLYNKEKTISDTIGCILKQSFTDFELLLIDDGSTDKSIEKVLEINDYRIRIVRKNNGGPSSARNLGMDNAQGVYGYFIDADDILVENGIQLIVDTIRENPSYSVYAFNTCISTKTTKKLQITHPCSGTVSNPFFKWLTYGFWPRPGAFVFKVNDLAEYRFNENYRRGEDDDFFYRVMRSFVFFSSPKVILEYNQETLQASGVRENWKEDFVCHLEPKGKSYWEKICLYRLFIEAKRMYPDVATVLYKGVFDKLYYKIGYALAMRYISYRWMLTRK